jgi:hypothetical protein
MATKAFFYSRKKIEIKLNLSRDEKHHRHTKPGNLV